MTYPEEEEGEEMEKLDSKKQNVLNNLKFMESMKALLKTQNALEKQKDAIQEDYYDIDEESGDIEDYKEKADDEVIEKEVSKVLKLLGTIRIRKHYSGEDFAIRNGHIYDKGAHSWKDICATIKRLIDEKAAIADKINDKDLRKAFEKFTGFLDKNYDVLMTDVSDDVSEVIKVPIKDGKKVLLYDNDEEEVKEITPRSLAINNSGDLIFDGIDGDTSITAFPYVINQMKEEISQLNALIRKSNAEIEVNEDNLKELVEKLFGRWLVLEAL